MKAWLLSVVHNVLVHPWIPVAEAAEAFARAVYAAHNATTYDDLDVIVEGREPDVSEWR